LLGINKDDRLKGRKEVPERLDSMELVMAGAINRFSPLYIAAGILLGIGMVGLGCVFILQLPSHISQGFRYIFVGFIAFGIGEHLNHPQTTSHVARPDSQQVYRERNVCSLGNLIDIGALLLFFVGLSTLFFPR
jgi:hypothetical protein